MGSDKENLSSVARESNTNGQIITYHLREESGPELKKGVVLTAETALLGGCAIFAALKGESGTAIFMAVGAGFVGAHAIEHFEDFVALRRQSASRQQGSGVVE